MASIVAKNRKHLVLATGAGMAGATFVATPSDDVCRTCPVRSSCPAQPEGRAL